MMKSKSLTQNSLSAIVKNFLKRERLKARLREAIFWETHYTVNYTTNDPIDKSGLTQELRISYAHNGHLRSNTLKAKLKKMDENY